MMLTTMQGENPIGPRRHKPDSDCESIVLDTAFEFSCLLAGREAAAATHGPRLCDSLLDCLRRPCLPVELLAVEFVYQTGLAASDPVKRRQ